MKFLVHLSTLILFTFFTSCNNNNPAEEALDEASTDMEEMIPESDTIADLQLADPNWLQEYLPAQVGDKTVTGTDTDLTNLMGYKITHAEASYGPLKRTTVSISDVSQAGTELGAIGAWIENDMNEVDQESFQRTSIARNKYRTLEKYAAEEKMATVSMLVGDRYLITATSENDFGVIELKAAILKMDLDQLANNVQ